MCKTKMATRTSSSIHKQKSNPRSNPPTPRNKSSLNNPNTFSSNNSTSSSYHLDTSIATTSSATTTSLSVFRETLPENTQIYDFSDIRSATNNFLSNRHSPNSQSWRCTLNNKNVVIFQRKLRKHVTNDELLRKLNVISKSHFTSIVKLLGLSISDQHVYLVYEFVQGTDLSLCLRNKKNLGFTVLSEWMPRMQIATDVAHGLDYIHSKAGLSIDMVHKYVKSSGILVTEPNFNAKICHFGAAELCGETKESEDSERRVEGVSGYMAPEFKVTGVATQKSDVYGFGVVLLELLTGKEPIRFSFDRKSGNYTKESVVESAMEVMRDEEGVEGRVRRWVDGRLRDSFPVDVVVKMTSVALECVREDPSERPEMKWVSGKISKLYLASKVWSERVKAPMEISVSLTGR